jgi:predicted unusual protein kinase regulating ubiquinone biosynthesis (AarF/ABC1/UbiB family)
MAFRHRMLHADPHPGNYLFETDGRIGLLDFGCVKRFNEFWTATYCKAALAAADGDREACVEALRETGAIRDGARPEAVETLWQFCDTIGGAFRDPDYQIGGPEDDVPERLTPIIKRLMRYPEIRAPKDVIFLHRSLGGIYSLGRKLQARGNWHPVMSKHAEYAIARAEGRL